MTALIDRASGFNGLLSSRRSSTPRVGRPNSGRPGELGRTGIFVLFAAAFLPVLDFFIVNVALPTIDSTLHASAPTLELVVAGYGTVYAALLVVGGRLGDSFGRRRVLLLGMAGFTVSSLLCGFAPSIGFLVAARLLQGAAAALIMPQVLATFQATLDGPRRARVLGMYGAVGGVATVIGQLLGGLLVTADIAGSSWRPIFLLNVPIGIAAVIAMRRYVPTTRSDQPAGVDLPGTVLFAGMLVAVLVPLTEGRTLHWPLWTWLVLATAPVLAYAVTRVEHASERHGSVPLLPPSLMRLRSMRRGLAFALPFFLGFGAFMFVFALTVQDGLHLDALHSGLAILPMAVPYFVGSLLTPRAIERFGRATLTYGSIAQGIGLVVLAGTVATRWPDVTIADMAPGLIIAGFGQAFVFGSLFRLILADVPARVAGIGGGVLITLQQSGLALGVATLGTLYLGVGGAGTGFVTVLAISAVVVFVLAAGSFALPHPDGVTAT